MTTKTSVFFARATGRAAQRGATLIELMVGITIGLLVVAVAMAALVVSRGISGTVSDASDIQQQSAYALRLLGSQLREAASMRLNIPLDAVAPAGGAAPNFSPDPMALVAFETKSGAGVSGDLHTFDTTTPAGLVVLLSGTDTTLTAGFARDQVSVFGSASPTTMAVNCIGGPADTAANAAVMVVQSAFAVAVNGKGVPELRCSGNGAAPQPVIQNVANFQVRYLVQNTAAPGNPQIQYLNAPAISDWSQVQGVEVCLVLYGKEAIGMPAGSTYTDCDGITPVDMTTLPGARRGRMHLVFRNVFQLRSMGVM